MIIAMPTNLEEHCYHFNLVSESVPLFLQLKLLLKSQTFSLRLSLYFNISGPFKMGIRDLWLVYSSLELSFHVTKKSPLQAVSPASQIRTLTNIAVTEGFEQHRRHMRCLLIGIDARYVQFTTLKVLSLFIYLVFG
jgi:hypothetical protein